MASPLSCDAKIVLLGNSGVGKTCLVYRYVQGSYSGDLTSTIGASFMTKRMFLDGVKVKLQIWDTAGQERFRSMTPMYYRAASAAILVYDVTSHESFEAVKEWVDELRSNVEEDVIIAIAGNKVDLVDYRQVSTKKAKDYAENIGAVFFETSALSAQGVEDLFGEISRGLVVNQAAKARAKRQGGGGGGGGGGADNWGSEGGIDLNAKGGQPSSGGGCCG
eukprot:TRINITY_DN3721_c0_g1_i1.p1 TRINITY_DN3721_c0_g1~~TRINITY_DN3721_c0_g1_i1.p1  ORF type:complete len:220 (+),score=50.71 TRINITY_DN3721_c0_g1_i1:217-876(+)